MKNHKATAQDPIPVEIYKYSKSKRHSAEIEKIIQECWHTSNVPDTFLDIILCSLFKSGNKQMCENQRGISLLSHLCKALTRLCANRISQYCEKEGILPESQSAFRKNRSTNDMVFTARLLQYSCMDKNIPLYLAFIDIAKAYDSVHRPTLWKILQTIGIPPKLLALLKTLYGENNCRVKFCNKFSKSFKLLEGLKQGCPAACILFNIFFSIVIFVIRQKLQTKGVQLKFRFDGDIFNLQRLNAKTKIEKTTILELLFADDAAVCATSEEDLNIIIQTFYEVFADFGLEMALKKTVIMLQRPTSNPNLTDPVININNKTLQVVDKFKYLGSVLQNNATADKEIASRIQKAVSNFHKLYQRVWKKKHLKLKLKSQVYRTIIFPTLTYGCETWNWSSKQMKKLEGTQYRFLRSIAGKTWRDKISYVDLLHLITKDAYNTNFDWANESNKGVSITAVETYCRLSRLRYTGHVARMGENRIPNLILHGEILQGQRKQGRPKKSFREGLKNDLHKFDLFGKYSEQNTFQEFVADRDKWRKMINKQAQNFQKNWENNKVKKSNARKEKRKH